MSKPKALPNRFMPVQITLSYPASSNLIAAAQAELKTKAQADANNCYGYFPAMKGAKNINTDLPHSQALALAAPVLNVSNKALKFNFVRLSLVQQRGDFPFHLDSDADTALTGDIATLSKRLVWRLLLNLSDEHPRKLSYLNVDSSTVSLGNSGGYIHCEDANLAKTTAQSVVIPPRSSTEVHGVLFCASRVLHTGQDDEYGHFVAGYGCETPDTGR